MEPADNLFHLALARGERPHSFPLLEPRQWFAPAREAFAEALKPEQKFNADVSPQLTQLPAWSSTTRLVLDHEPGERRGD
jgi:hypothetical protein